MQDIPKLIEDYNDRFKSGNSIPVERIWMTRDMWWELRKVLERAEADKQRLSLKDWEGVK